MIKLALRIKLETPLKRERVQDDDLRSPVRTPMHLRHHSPNSIVKVCNGPWDRHIRIHKSSPGHGNNMSMHPWRASALDGCCVRESKALANALPEDALAKTHEVVSRDFGDAVMDIVVCSAKRSSKWC